MKILLDECLPKRLKSLLSEFEVKTATEMGWRSVRNGQLLTVAQQNGFEIFLTVDKKLEYQQNLKKYNLTVVVFDVPRTKLENIIPLIPKFIRNIASFEKGKAYTIR